MKKPRKKGPCKGNLPKGAGLNANAVEPNDNGANKKDVCSMKNDTHSHGKPHVHGKLFSDIHSCIEKEWLYMDITVPDDERTLSAKESSDGTYEKVMDYVDALCFQLRYREALACCESLYKTYPNVYRLERRLGVLYFKLLKFDESQKFLTKCLFDTDEELQLTYILAVVCYYKEDYQRAKSLLSRCAVLSADDGEMYVAVLYWFLCCSVRFNHSFDELKNLAKNYNFDCGHHLGYDGAVRFALDMLSEAKAESFCDKDTALNRCCLNYGLSVIFESKDKEKCRKYLSKSLEDKDLFGAYSYIAGYNDFNRKNQRNP